MRCVGFGSILCGVCCSKDQRGTYQSGGYAGICHGGKVSVGNSSRLYSVPGGRSFQRSCYLVWIQYYPHWKKTEDSSSKLGIFSTVPARSFPNNLASEVIGTFMLLFGLSFLGINNFSSGLNSLVIGVYISAISFSLGGTTGFTINPARDFGPRPAHFVLPISGKGSSDGAYFWIPVVGPLIGGVYGTLFYQPINLFSTDRYLFGSGFFHCLKPLY